MAGRFCGLMCCATSVALETAHQFEHTPSHAPVPVLHCNNRSHGSLAGEPARDELSDSAESSCSGVKIDDHN